MLQPKSLMPLSVGKLVNYFPDELRSSRLINGPILSRIRQKKKNGRFHLPLQSVPDSWAAPIGQVDFTVAHGLSRSKAGHAATIPDICDRWRLR